MKLSSFSVILIFVVMMVMGFALAPLLDVGTDPTSRQGKQLTIRCEWPQVSAKVVEQNLTAPIEGMVSALKGVESVSSRSSFGHCEVNVRLKENQNVSTVKFSISSMLRQSYAKFPKGISFPMIEGGEIVNGQKANHESQLLLTYHVNADMQPEMIKKLISGMVVRPLETIDGVTKVEVTGTTERYMEVSYDPMQLSACGVTPQEMQDAIRNYIGKDEVVGTMLQTTADHKQERVAFRLVTANKEADLASVPIKKIGGKVIYLNDLAQIKVKKQDPLGYYRVNGLNTIYINVYASADANFVRLSDAVQEEMNVVKSQIRQPLYVHLAYDSAQQQRDETAKLVGRTLLSLLFLLAFVFVVYRSFKYLSVVAFALAANILMAIIAYWAFGLKLHVYSLAGITVSMGLIIDSTIVMADHYGYYHNRKAFLSILAAMLTSIGSLIIIFFLPQEMQDDLSDFAWIVIVNLVVALLVSFFFVPALMEQWHCAVPRLWSCKRRFVVRWNHIYHRYLLLTSRHRWVYYIALLWAFGIPFHALPEDWGMDKCGFLTDYLGGISQMFVDYLDGSVQRRNADERKTLHVQALMPVGGTAVQLNDKMILVEELLKKYPEIKEFVTRIDGRQGEITVKFRDGVDASFPYRLESMVIGKVITIGGADWSTYGVSERGFSNSIDLQYKANRIKISGYNYAQLYRLSENISGYLGKNPRVQDIAIETPGFENQEDEVYVDYQKDRLGMYGLSPYDIHRELRMLLSPEYVGAYKDHQMNVDVYLKPLPVEQYDLWHMENSQFHVDSLQLFASDVMKLQRREAKEVIPKEKQEYVLNVAFNVLGSYTYTTEYLDSVMAHFKRTLPVGYHCEMPSYKGADSEGANYWLLLLVAVLIFFICSVVFESLRMALVVVSMIPVSLIGAFLTFIITGVEFGSGGFASLVLLSGIVVNSAIYILCQYAKIQKEKSISRMKAYLCAFNHKIVPIYLTVISTIVGLVPFFLEQSEEPFWFSFAVGITGGLLLSIPAMIFVMPLFLKF